MEPGADITSTGAAPSMSLEHDLFGDSVTNPDNVPTVAEEEALAPIASPTGQVTDAQAPQLDEEEEEVGDDLFGDGDDDDEDVMDQDQTATAHSDEEGLSSRQREERKRMEYDEADGSERDSTPEFEEKDQTVAQISLGNFGRPPDGKVWHARLPNFLSLDPAPFDQPSWEPPVREEVDPDDDAARHKAELPDENVIRWRWGKDQDGNDAKQSNSRVVRWSDGSLSLQVGAELFDISATVDHSALMSSAAATPLIPSSHAPELNNFNQSRQHGLTYLTAKHGYTSLVEAQASVHGTITFRPTTLQSATHRRLAGTVNSQHAKARAIKMAAVPDRDPEREKLEREKAEEDKARKLKREQQKAAGGVRRKLGARPGTRMVGGSEDEASDGASDGGVYERREQPRRSAAGPQEDDYDDDGFVVGSDEEEERTRGGRGDEEVEEADERIEREERRRKDRRREKRDFSDSDDEDAEAEPEPTAQRRRVVVDSDDE